jgi:hypothetical protein
MHSARVRFANLVNFAKSVEYTNLMEHEQRQQVRRDYRHHPITTWKRERHNRKVRAQHEKQREIA